MFNGPPANFELQRFRLTWSAGWSSRGVEGVGSAVLLAIHGGAVCAIHTARVELATAWSYGAVLFNERVITPAK